MTLDQHIDGTHSFNSAHILCTLSCVFAFVCVCVGVRERWPRFQALQREERVWYTLLAHAPRPPEKCRVLDINVYVTVLYSHVMRCHGELAHAGAVCTRPSLLSL